MIDTSHTTSAPEAIAASDHRSAPGRPDTHFSMKSIMPLRFALAVRLGCAALILGLAMPALAQKILPPNLGKAVRIPTLKNDPKPAPVIRGDLKSIAKKKKTPISKRKALLAKNGKKNAKKSAKKSGKTDIARRPPPGGKTSKDSKLAEEKAPLKWQDVEDKDPDRLSADFIKNCPRISPSAKMALDITDEELDTIVKMMACMVRKNIIVSKPLKGKKITVYSPVKVSPSEVYRVFLTALAVNGMTITPKGRFLQIIEIKDAQRTSEMPLSSGRTPPNEDRMVTQIIQVDHVDAQEVNEVIAQLASEGAQIIVHQPTNRLIVTELGSNLRKLRRIIRSIDRPGGQEQLWTYEVEHAEAAEIASKINEVFEPKAAGAASSSKRRSTSKRRKSKRKRKAAKTGGSNSVGQSDMDASASKVIADERTNRLFIVATARSYRIIKRFIRSIDISIEGDGQVHIHQLNHAKAADLASVLSSLSNEQKSSRGSSARKRSSSKKKSSKGSTGATSAALFEGEVSVTADEDTNALVITSSLKDYLSLKKVIDVLDRPRRQVFIEAVIMEVSIRNQRNFGINLHGGKQIGVSGEQIPLLFSHQPISGASSLNLASAAALQGLAAAAQGPDIEGFEVGGQSIPSFGVVMRALAQSDDVHILSTPHVLTTDNEEAELTVGSNVPFIAGIAGGGLGGGLGGGAGGGLGGFFPTVNVQRQDVALTLKITPRINAENFVTLEIDQVIEEIESIDPQVGPTTSKRSIKTTVVVQDQNTVVIGGLQKDRQAKGTRAIPLLGEVPIIGYFFRDSNTDRERRNLLLLLTPHVIEGPHDFREIHRRKMEEHREFAARFNQKGEGFELGIDYGKKHGAMESIRQSLREAAAEQRVLDELRKQEERPPLPQELDGIEIEAYPSRKKAVEPSNDKAPDDAPPVGADAGDVDADDMAGDYRAADDPAAYDPATVPFAELPEAPMPETMRPVVAEGAGQ
ncbi:MAG: general secretion pathway protein D [Bradymonadia bacterium]|jgi:general secretion pathway protein D